MIIPDLCAPSDWHSHTGSQVQFSRGEISHYQQVVRLISRSSVVVTRPSALARRKPSAISLTLTITDGLPDKQSEIPPAATFAVPLCRHPRPASSPLSHPQQPRLPQAPLKSPAATSLGSALRYIHRPSLLSFSHPSSLACSRQRPAAHQRRNNAAMRRRRAHLHSLSPVVSKYALRPNM